MFFSIERAVRICVTCVTPRLLITPHPALETNQRADKPTSIGIDQPFQELCLSIGRPPHLADMSDAASAPSRRTDSDILVIITVPATRPSNRFYSYSLHVDGVPQAAQGL